MAEMKLDLVADARRFVASMKDAARSMLGLGDAIDDVADESEDSLGKVEQAIRDVEKQADKSGSSIGRDLDRGFHKAEEGAEEFRQESTSTAREAAASFGDVTDALDAVQELAANAFAGFGPAGAAAGLAAAVGIGLVTSEFQKAQEHAQELRERVAGIRDELLDAGGDPTKLAWMDKFTDWLDAVDEGTSGNSLTDFLTDTGTRMDLVNRSAKNLGVSSDDLIEALSGKDARQAANILTLIDAAIARATRTANTGTLEQADNASRLINQYRDLRTQIEDATRATSEGASEAEQLARTRLAMGDRVIAKQEEAAQAEIDSANRMSASVVAAYGGVEQAAIDAATADDAKIPTDWATYFQSQVDAIAAIDSTAARIKALGLDEAATSHLTDLLTTQGTEFVNAELDAFGTLPVDKQNQIVNSWASLGGDAGAAAATKMRAAIPDRIDVQIHADTLPLETQVNLAASRLALAGIKIPVSATTVPGFEPGFGRTRIE